MQVPRRAGARLLAPWPPWLDAREGCNQTSRSCGLIRGGDLSRMERAKGEGVNHSLREASRSSRARLRSTPQAYPESEPSLRTTRWQGMATARLFAAHAAATARAACGDPMRLAISA